MLILHILYAELDGLEKSFLERHKEHGFLQGFTFSATTPVSISIDLSTVSTSTSTCRRLVDVDRHLSTASTACRRRGAVLDVSSTSTSRRQVPVDVDKPSTTACRRQQKFCRNVEKIPLPSRSLSTSTSLSTLPPCGAKSKSLEKTNFSRK